jgi:hypothetical protein
VSSDSDVIVASSLRKILEKVLLSKSDGILDRHTGDLVEHMGLPQDCLLIKYGYAMYILNLRTKMTSGII